ncbi:MAG: STAS domain-containing protein [Bacteroidia bacterium]|nr:STAS domain-containing protein [Bacteroidia bacterium]
MEINTVHINGITIFEISGHLNATNAKDLESVLLQTIDGGNLKIIADLGKLEYVSSAGLRVLLLAAKKIGKSGYIRVCSLQQQVSEVFHMSGFDAIFSIYPNREEALKEN